MAKKTRISDYDMCRVGTVAHNRNFSPRDLSEHLRKDTRAMFRRMQREGLIKRASRGAYYPTERGWRAIENACEGVGR